MEGNNVLSTKKVQCSSNKKIFDFAEEIFFKLHGRNPGLCSLKIQIKKNLGLSKKSKALRFLDKNIFKLYFLIDELIAEDCLGCDSQETFQSHWKAMIEKPEDRIYTWHDFASDSKSSSKKI